MDYKYIEQLLERYWECLTTLEEETILRSFFRQEDIPAGLLPYKRFFLEEEAMAHEQLPADFAEKMLRLTEAEEPPRQVFHAKRLTFARRIRPFYQAAGLVALLLTIGDAAQQSMTDNGDTPQTAEIPDADSLQRVRLGTSEQHEAALTVNGSDSVKAYAP